VTVKTKRACVIDATGRKHCGRLVGASRNNPAAKRSRASAGKTSLGARLVELGNPAAASDVQMLGLGPAASLDEVCYALAGTGLYRADALRINALRALALKIEDDFSEVKPAMEWLSGLHPRLGVWSAASVAREALPLARGQERLARTAIETAEAWVAGLVTQDQAKTDTIAAFKAAKRLASEDASAPRARPRSGRSIEAQDLLPNVGDAALTAFDAAASTYAGSLFLGLTADGALRALQAESDVDSIADVRAVERRLLTRMLERLPLFPAWQGAPAQDRWPMTAAGKSLCSARA